MSFKACSRFKMYWYFLSLPAYPDYDAIQGAGLIERSELRFDKPVYPWKRDNLRSIFFLQNATRIIRR